MYITGKVPQPKTTEWYRTEKMENKQHKDKYLRGNDPQRNTTERLRTEKMEKKQHKDDYLRGKVPQPKKNIMVSEREDGEETGQRQVSQGQGSTSEGQHRDCEQRR